MWLPPWVKEIGAAIGLVLSGVAFVRLVVSGLSAFVDILTWSGVVAAAVFTLLALVGAIRPNEEVTRKGRIGLASQPSPWGCRSSPRPSPRTATTRF